MNIKKYFWDLNKKALKETENIIKNPEHPKFVERMFTILSRCDVPKEVFSIITKKQFIEVWPKIRNYWSKIKQANDFKAWWETIYEQLIDNAKQLKGKQAEIFVNIGKIIRENRIKTGMSQMDFARRVGMKQPDISAIEFGKKNITLETLIKLCRVLNIKNLPLSAIDDTNKESESVRKERKSGKKVTW